MPVGCAGSLALAGLSVGKRLPALPPWRRVGLPLGMPGRLPTGSGEVTSAGTGGSFAAFGGTGAGFCGAGAGFCGAESGFWGAGF